MIDDSAGTLKYFLLFCGIDNEDIVCQAGYPWSNIFEHVRTLKRVLSK